MKQKLIYLFAALIVHAVSQGQASGPAGDQPIQSTSGMIKGMVHDSTTQGEIEYATVGLYRLSDSSLVSGVVTDPNGTFLFKDLARGAYYLEINFIGYAKKRISPVSITPQSPTVNLGVIVLHPNITQIAEVQVVAQNQRVEYKIDKKVVNVSQDISAAGGSLVNVLENTPSVQVDVEGNVSLRGSSNFQLLVDGKPSVIQGSEGLQQIPANAVQSLEIITSPSAKYDPDGAAGIINVIMKKQKNTGMGGVVNASVGTRHKYTADFLLNFKRNKLNYFIGGEFADQNNYNTGESERRTYLGDTTTYILTGNDGVFSRISVNLKSGFDYYINDKATLSLSGAVGSRGFSRVFVSNNRWFTLPASRDSFYRVNNTSADNDLFYNINLDFVKKYNDNGHELQASVYYANSRENEEEEDVIRTTNSNYQVINAEPTRTRARTETPEQELRMELDYAKPVGSGKIEAGLQSRWDWDKANYYYEDFQPIGNEWLQNDSISNSLDYLDILQSGYMIYSGTLGKLNYQTGLRAEYDNRRLDQKTSSESFTYEKIHLFPSIHITRKLSEAHQFQFSYTRRIQRPDERDLNPFKEFRGPDNVFYGNPSLRPEFTNSFELNYQYNFGKSFISFETYYRSTYDKITRINGYDTIAGRPVFTFTSTNADRDHSLGMELMTNLEITPWWQLNLTGNLFRYQLEGRIEGNKRTSVSTSWRINFNSTFKLKWDTRLQFTGFYNGPSNTLQGRREGFFVANAAIRKEMFKKKLSISLNARDIFATGVFAFTSEGTSFYTSNKGRREAPVVTLSLTYRINNYRQNGRRSSDEPSGNEGGGMDMEM